MFGPPPAPPGGGPTYFVSKSARLSKHPQESDNSSIAMLLWHANLNTTATYVQVAGVKEQA
jgi:hypothetical protein